MNLDEFQQIWQTQDVGREVRIDADSLLNEVRRNRRNFRATILSRNFSEILAAGLSFPCRSRGTFAGWPWLSLA